MQTCLFHPSRLPDLSGAVVFICAGVLLGTQCARGHWTSVPTHDCLVFRKKHRRKRCPWGRRSPQSKYLGFFWDSSGSGHFLDLRRPEWNQEESLTSHREGRLAPPAGKIFFPFTSASCLLLEPSGRAGNSSHLNSFTLMWDCLRTPASRGVFIAGRGGSFTNGILEVVVFSLIEGNGETHSPDHGEEPGRRRAVRSRAFPGGVFPGLTPQLSFFP